MINLDVKNRANNSTNVEPISDTEYNNKVTKIKRRINGLNLVSWQNREIIAEEGVKKTYWDAGRAVLKTGTSQLKYVRAGVELLTEGEKLANDFKKLNGARANTKLTEARISRQLGVEKVPTNIKGSFSLSLPDVPSSMKSLSQGEE